MTVTLLKIVSPPGRESHLRNALANPPSDALEGAGIRRIAPFMLGQTGFLLIEGDGDVLAALREDRTLRAWLDGWARNAAMDVDRLEDHAYDPIGEGPLDRAAEPAEDGRKVMLR